ncbi:MAG: SDR family oxidoreductase [Clostridia bacterium]|nr:SDR family oxidoreductase [Clostridia bacterium]NCC43225.1 SDR family oxidoreductase [Clostridia bacterium]
MLEGKTAVVTGGTRGIGYEVVKKYLSAGAKVALCGSRQETVDKALAKIKKENPQYQVMGICPDLSDYEQVKEAFDQVRKEFGKIDILANNAGISARESIYEYDPADFSKIMDLNVKAVFHCSKAAAPIMKEQGGGVIINTSSMVSLYGQRSGCGYPASKSAVNGLTKSLARELGPDKIRVNAVAPGVIKTDMVAALPADMVERLVATIPLGRMGEPEDIANAFLFLASDLASYVTGTILSVDGATIS